MIRWGEYLEMLKAEGVSLETVTHEVLTDEGDVLTTRFLLRWSDGRPLYYPVTISSMQEPVSRHTLRQIANVLRLPPEKYIFPREMR